LSSCKKIDPTLKALIAFDEIIMTDYLLDYIDSREIREVVQGSLNLKTAVEHIPANKNQHKLDKEN
jgi:TnpA family transposase